MSANPPTKILERVRKLLAQASDDAVTPQEAEAFASRAAELMARHGVEQAMLDAHRDPTDDPMAHRRIDLDRPYPHERGLLLASLGHVLNIHVRWGKRAATMVGRRSDLDRAEQLYTALLLFMATELTRPVDTSWCWDAGEARTATRQYRQSWLLGFIDRVSSRMRTARREATKDAGTGAEVVLADRRSAAKLYADEQLGKVGKHRARTARDSRAYDDGFTAGASVDLGQSRLGGGDPRAIGGAA